MKALMMVLAATIDSDSELASKLAELITEGLLDRLIRLGLYDLTFMVVRQLHLKISDELLQLLEKFIGNRCFWGEQELCFLVEAIQCHADQPLNPAFAKITQMYFN